MSDVRCKGCPLEGQPKVFNAVKKADICIVGESPGKQEEEDGKPFVGPSGALLWKTLQEFGIYRIDVAILNACRCRIPQDFKKRFKNVETVVSYCKPFFEEDLAAVSPKLILCLGEISYYQLTGKRSFSRDRGKPLQHPTLDAVIVPLYHPAYILYSGGRSETNPQFLIWRNEIQNALSLIRKDIVVDNSIGDIVPLREGCIKGEAIAVDAEWNEEDELLIFSICDGDKVYYVLPEDLDRLRSYVNELFSTKVVIFANRPADERILLRYGIRFPKYAADIFNIARLLNDNLHKVSLDAIVKLVLADFSLKEEVKNKHVWELDRETLILYNAKDSFVTRKAFSRLYKELKQDYPLFKYWKYFILPVEEMLADVGCKGFPINREKLEELRIQVDAEWTRMALDLMNRIPDKIKAVHTGKLSLTSNALIARYVFSPKKQGGLGFKPQKHTATGAISVDEDHLSRFKHKSKWVRDFLNWKQLEKMRSTYINGLAKNTHLDGKIYPSIVLYATATGRTACYNPNIQQVPRKALPFVKEFKSLYSAPEGWVMCARDLSQSEIRIVAWLAQEKNMLKALYDGVDIHSHTASVLLGKPISEITKDERQLTKCFHPDVEVLTQNGWVKFKDYNGVEPILAAIPVDHEGVRFSWQTPLYFELRRNHEDKIVHLFNEGIDIKVTPDHRMLGMRNTGKFYVTTPSEFNKVRYFYNAGTLSGFLDVNEWLLRFIVATQADGSLNRRKDGSIASIRFGFRKKRKVKRLLWILEGLKWPYRMSVRNGVVSFVVDYQGGFDPFLDTEKAFTWELLGLKASLRKVFIEELFHWDGARSKRHHFRYYFTVKRRNADIVQTLCVITGYKASIGVYKPRKKGHNINYTVRVKPRPYSRGENISYREESYRGNVAVITVPSTFLLVRYRGKTLVTGQCINFGLLYGMQAFSFQRYAEKEYGIKMTLAEAERFRKKYFEAYPQLPAFHRRCIQIVEKYGYIRSVLGRVRRLPTAKSQDFKVRNEAYRQAINFCVQSFSSDLALLGMWLFWKEVKDKSDVQVLWFIHDAVFFICEESKADHYMALLKECMEERAPQYVEDKFKVTVGYPVVSDGKVGKDWGHMEEYKEAS